MAAALPARCQGKGSGFDRICSVYIVSSCLPPPSPPHLPTAQAGALIQ